MLHAGYEAQNPNFGNWSARLCVETGGRGYTESIVSGDRSDSRIVYRVEIASGTLRY